MEELNNQIQPRKLTHINLHLSYASIRTVDVCAKSRMLQKSQKPQLFAVFLCEGIQRVAELQIVKRRPVIFPQETYLKLDPLRYIRQSEKLDCHRHIDIFPNIDRRNFFCCCIHPPKPRYHNFSRLICLCSQATGCIFGPY